MESNQFFSIHTHRVAICANATNIGVTSQHLEMESRQVPSIKVDRSRNLLL